MVSLQAFIQTLYDNIGKWSGLSLEDWVKSGGLNQPLGAYNGQTPMQILQQISGGQVTDPLNQLNYGLPDPLKGSLMPASEDIGGFLLAAAPAAAMAGGAAGVGGLSNAGWGTEAAVTGSGAWNYGPLASAGVSDVPQGVMGASDFLGDLPIAGDTSGTSLWSNSALQGGAMDMGGSQGVFDSAGNPLYTSPAGVGPGTAKTAYDSLKQILDNGGSVDDWLKIAGAAAPGLLGALGNYQSGQSLKDLASQQKSQFDQFQAMGAPYRQRLSDLYANPGGYLNSPEVQVPVQQGTDALARSLSAKVGNPIGNMTALSELQNYSANQLFGKLGQEKDRLAGFGGLSAYNQTGAGAPLATQLQQLGIGADAGVWGGLGRAAGDVFNPAPTTLADLLKQMQGNNIFTTTGA